MKIILLFSLFLFVFQADAALPRSNLMFRCQTSDTLPDMRYPTKLSLMDLAAGYYHLVPQDSVGNIQPIFHAYELSGYLTGLTRKSMEENKGFDLKLRDPNTLKELSFHFIPRGLEASNDARYPDAKFSSYEVQADSTYCALTLKDSCKIKAGQMLTLGTYLCH
ncbi:MAG: hypothetical protein AB1540_01730 [Bdellovibrionota bacterium]